MDSRGSILFTMQFLNIFGVMYIRLGKFCEKSKDSFARTISIDNLSV